MVISSLGAAGLPESDNYMQSDSADGSGSGGGPDFTDDSDDLDARSGSGSGNGPIVVQSSKYSLHFYYLPYRNCMYMRR